MATHSQVRQEEARRATRGHLVDIGPDPTTREWVWRFVGMNFPGGRPQFEEACNRGWVRVLWNDYGFNVEIGPPDQEPPPPPRSEAPPPAPPKNPREQIPAALKTLGYKKLDSPTPAEIKDRYRDLARRHHPDLATTPAKRDRATERMQRINVAYDLLKGQGVAV